jgi:hypothetical protein
MNGPGPGSGRDGVVPLSVRIDAGHGGRWTSLRGGGREWLWRRDEPRRAAVAPGDAFADAGGLEECVPTVRGVPDHGDAWSRPWTAIGDTVFEDTRPEETVTGNTVLGNAALENTVLEHAVRCTDFELTRRIDVRTGSVVADYRLTAEPGFRFVWAGHALLELSARALLEIDQDPHTDPGGALRARLYPEAAPYLSRPWPDGAAWLEGDWPAPAGLRLDTLGPDDGSAVGAVVYAADPAAAGTTASALTAVVRDGPDSLRMTVRADAAPTGIALWRNLGGFPSDGPYRSVGVEPMLGRVFDLAHAAGVADSALTPATGEVRWQLTISAYHRN